MFMSVCIGRVVSLEKGKRKGDVHVRPVPATVGSDEGLGGKKGRGEGRTDGEDDKEKQEVTCFEEGVPVNWRGWG